VEVSWHGFVRHRARERAAFTTLIRRLIPLLSPYRLATAELGILMVLGVALTLATPLIIMQLIDHVIPHATGYRDLVIFSLALLLAFFLNAAVGARRSYAQHWLNERVATDLNHQLFVHLQRLSHNFYARTRTSELMTTLNEELREVQEAMALVAGTGLYQALLATATAVTVILLDPLLGILVLVIVPVFGMGYALLRAQWQREARGLQRRHAAAEQTVLENLSAHAEVKAFGLEKHVIETYHGRHQAVFDSRLRLVSLGALFESSLQLASGVGHAVVFGVGGYQIIAGTGGVTIGVLFAFAHLLPLFYEPIEKLADIGYAVEGAAAALDRIDEIVEEPIAVADKPDAFDLPPLSREIRLDQVSFGYGGDQPILQDLSLTIAAGSEVAIVGPSGSGKSTIIALLMRFWDPEAGRVVFDEHDARDVTLSSLRAQIGLVSQETFIFDTSVRENIAIGRPDADDVEIERAAEAAQLHDFILSLPSGYHTMLGERGVRMSGGQRQRLAIARALLRDPRILILDEATSALDPQTETEIQETLAVAAKGRTLISVTHRLAAVVTADRIFVLDHGRLVEQGHHAELVKAGGLYQRLYEEQMHYLHGGGVLRQGIDIDRLRSIPLFTNLADEALRVVADRFLLERYAAGEVVVRQGDAGDKLYTISRGELDVLIAKGDGEQPVNTLHEGEYFGEMAVLTGEPRTATIRTSMPTQLYSLAKSDFTLLMDRVPGLRESVEPTIASRRVGLARAAAAAANAGSDATNGSSGVVEGDGTTVERAR
jgi:ATP-binding cassette subfamily B protein